MIREKNKHLIIEKIILFLFFRKIYLFHQCLSDKFENKFLVISITFQITCYNISNNRPRSENIGEPVHALLREREERGRLAEPEGRGRHHLLQGYPEHLHRWYLPRDTLRSQHGIERHWGCVRRVQGEWDLVQPQVVHDDDRASVTWVRSIFSPSPSPNFCFARLSHRRNITGFHVTSRLVLLVYARFITRRSKEVARNETVEIFAFIRVSPHMTL